MTLAAAIRRRINGKVHFLADPGKLIWRVGAKLAPGMPGPPYWSPDPDTIIKFSNERSAKAVAEMWFPDTEVEVIPVAAGSFLQLSKTPPALDS